MATLVITPEIEAGAQQLAIATGTTPTEAVEAAVHSQIDRLELNRPVQRKIDIEAVMKLLKSLDGPVDYSLTDDEILGYDEYGVPEQPYLDRR